MSNKRSKKNKKKQAKKAKVKVLSVIPLEANKHVALLSVEDAPAPLVEASSWTSFINWLKAGW